MWTRWWQAVEAAADLASSGHRCQLLVFHNLSYFAKHVHCYVWAWHELQHALDTFGAAWSTVSSNQGLGCPQYQPPTIPRPGPT